MQRVSHMGGPGAPGQGGANGPDVDFDRWSDVVRRFAPYVHTTAVRVYGLPERLAEEVFDEVFVRTWMRIDALTSEDWLREWIVDVTRRVAADRREAARGT